MSERAETERAAIRAAWHVEFDEGARCGALQKFDGEREAGGYPLGFHSWPLERRNAWYAGFNAGYTEKKKMEAQDD
jgi:hypothetical protein